jgi:hypothetical protein
MADVGWVHGSLVEPAIEDEPGPGGPDVVQLLEQAEDIIDAVVPETLAEVKQDESRASRTGRRWPWRRR